jgi:hypothetical protein
MRAVFAGRTSGCSPRSCSGTTPPRDRSPGGILAPTLAEGEPSCDSSASTERGARRRAPPGKAAPPPSASRVSVTVAERRLRLGRTSCHSPGMILRTSVALCAVSLLLASPALAATGAHGRSSWAQAAIDAALVSPKGHVVEVLDQLCRHPAEVRGCTPIPPRMRAALEDAVDRRIEWVYDRDPRAAEFWIFAPVVFDRARAEAGYAFWESGISGCDRVRGGETLDLRLDRGSWVWSSGLGWATCVR